MKKIGLVKASTLEPFLRFLTQEGINLTPFLHRANIGEQLVQEQDTWLPKQQVYNFLTDIAATNDLEALGLIVGDQICVDDLGALGDQVYACKTLEEACQKFASLVPKFAEGNTASLQVEKDEVWFSYQTNDHTKGTRDYADHYGMMMLLSVVRLVGGRDWIPNEVRIQTGPSEAFNQHPNWVNCDVTFDANETGFCFPKVWLKKNIQKPADIILSDTEYQSNPPTTLNESLRIILSAYMNLGGIPAINNMATALSMSERSLKRKLAEEGTTYSKIVEALRMDTAKRLLETSVSTTKQIAYILGYSGANNFIRAFQRNESCSPSEYRKRKRRMRRARN